MNRKYAKNKKRYPRVKVTIGSRSSTNSKPIKHSRSHIKYNLKKHIISNKRYHCCKKNGIIAIPPITSEERTPRPKLPYED